MVNLAVMKRVLPLLLFLFIAGICALSVRYSLRRRAQKRRELTYQTVLGTYSQSFKSGMTRKEVEDRLRAKNVSFRQMCCVDIKEFKKSSWDDLVKIGEEDVPWVCGGNNVYVAFQFADHEEHEGRWQANAFDTLKALSVYHQLEGCL